MTTVTTDSPKGLRPTGTYHLTVKSGNKKVGPIPVSTSTKDTCPDTCPMKEKGCYAKGGPLAIHWSQVTKGTRGVSWGEFLQQIEALPQGQLWRHNQAGDLPHTGGEINLWAMNDLIRANQGKRGFTYTHHKLDVGSNLKQIKWYNKQGFTVNASADSLAMADDYVNLGLPTVVVLPSDQTENTRTPQGYKVVVCPATQREDVTCATCRLCSVSDRNVVVGFPAHGSQKKHVDRIAALNLS